MSKMESLFPEELVRNPRATDEWTDEEVDKLLNAYFAGTPPDRIAVQLGRNPKAINRRLEQYRCNERDMAERYVPVNRYSRRGARITENEALMIRSFRQKKIPMRFLTKLLQREINELGIDSEELAALADMKMLGPGVDLIWAYRYCYYVKGISILPDRAYDALEREEIEFGRGGGILEKMVGSDNADDYPPHIRALALYLLFKNKESSAK